LWAKIFDGLQHEISDLSLTQEPLGKCVYWENTSDSWDNSQYTTQKCCITSIYIAIKGIYFLYKLKELRHGILSYFGHIRNNLQIEGNLKIIVYWDRDNTKELIINLRGTRMVKDGEV